MRRRQVRPGVRGRKPTCARQGRRAGSEGVAGAGPGPLLRCARQGGARRQVTRRPPRSPPPRSPPAAPGCPRVRPPHSSFSPSSPAPPPACALTSLQVFRVSVWSGWAVSAQTFAPPPRFSSPNSGSPLAGWHALRSSPAPCPRTWEASSLPQRRQSRCRAG